MTVRQKHGTENAKPVDDHAVPGPLISTDLQLLNQINESQERLTIDEIREQLSPLFKGMKVESPVFDSGVALYRARRIGPTFNKNTGIKYKDLIYPPKTASKLGRLNRDGEQVLYCSVNKESVFFEVGDLQPGDEIILTFWQTTERMVVNNIGHTQHVFKRLGAKRDCPQWRSPEGQLGNKAVVSLPALSQQQVDVLLSHDKNSELRRALSEYFMCSVPATEMFRYKMTAAIGELHLGTIVNQGPFAGVLYPSARAWANGDNVALLPWFADRHLIFKKASHVRIDNREETIFSITTLDVAHGFGKDGNLVWLGGLPIWTVKPGQAAKFTCASGIDKDGDYLTGPDGTPCHWVATDVVTGQALENR
jgi:hypothetical protein